MLQDRKKLFDLAPWLGTFFWIGLWLWLLLADPGDTVEIPTVSFTAKPPEVELQGFSIRYMTRYSDFKTTWLEISAAKGRSMEEDSTQQILEDVSVKVVVKNDALEEEAEASGDFSDLSKQLGIDWLQIQSATGVFTFDKKRSIELHGNVQVFGYNREGRLNEWIRADTLVFDQEHGMVRSVGPAHYDGNSSIPIKPCIAQIVASLDLSAIEADFQEALNPATFQSPLTDPSLRPPYQPPEALRFLDSPPSGIGDAPNP